jgi:hypothetical protein
VETLAVTYGVLEKEVAGPYTPMGSLWNVRCRGHKKQARQKLHAERHVGPCSGWGGGESHAAVVRGYAWLKYPIIVCTL